MSIKDKIAIGLTVFLVVVFGFILKGTLAAEDVSSNIVTSLPALASKATHSKSDFMNIDANELYGKYILQGDNSTVLYKAGMCMYHSQSTNWNDKSKYYIYNVIDFKFDAGFVLENNRKYC